MKNKSGKIGQLMHFKLKSRISAVNKPSRSRLQSKFNKPAHAAIEIQQAAQTRNRTRDQLDLNQALIPLADGNEQYF